MFTFADQLPPLVCPYSRLTRAEAKVVLDALAQYLIYLRARDDKVEFMEVEGLMARLAIYRQWGKS